MIRRAPAALALCACLLAATLPALAASSSPALRRAPAGSYLLQPAKAGECSGGLVNDDGTFESRPTVPDRPSLDATMAFDLPQSPSTLRKICLCWTSAGGATSVDFDLLVYDADGAAGLPHTVLGGLGGLRAQNVPLFPQVAFYTFDVAALGWTLPNERVYIGPSWDTESQPDIRLCGDDTAPTFQPLLYSTNQGGDWNDLGGFFPDLKAIGVRAEARAGGTPSVCTPDDTTLCLNQGRFQVRLAWRRPNGETGVGHAVPFGSDDSGLLWFFTASNWEMLIKVLNGCGLNQRYWVFFAAVTNVQFTLTITDTDTGVSKTYENPQGMTAQTKTDTGAFATCP